MTTSDTEATYAEDHEPDDVLDEEWLASTQRRSRFRSVLVLTLAAAVVFLGGVLVQQEFGSADSAETATGLPEGFPQGMPTSGSGPSGPATAETRTSIVGKVVAIDGDVWTVEDLGGTTHQIVVTDDADIVRETKVSAADVEIDSTVDITLSDDESGTDTASDIVLR